jgi:hypothetical protein
VTKKQLLLLNNLMISGDADVEVLGSELVLACTVLWNLPTIITHTERYDSFMWRLHQQYGVECDCPLQAGIHGI